MLEKKNKNILLYVGVTYLLFWFMILGVCGVAIMVFDASQEVMRWLTALCSWMPTVALFILFRRLKPNTSIKDFYKDLFKEKINWKVLISVTVLIAGVFLLSVASTAVIQGLQISTQLTFVAGALLSNIFFTAIQGASGEESGWRGYLLPELEHKYGFLKGNIFLGFIWAFWHLPLWFLSTEYTGLNLLIYIFGFILGLVSFSMIMGIFMKKWRHLFLAFWMHFLFNFVLSFFIGQDVYLIVFLGIFYFISALILTLIFMKKQNIQDTPIVSN